MDDLKDYGVSNLKTCPVCGLEKISKKFSGGKHNWLYICEECNIKWMNHLHKNNLRKEDLNGK
jgi:transposase-like protein